MAGAFECDVAVVGGGPGGAVAAHELARAGHHVTLFEKSCGARFHIGESLLPRTATELSELGLLQRMQALPHIVKRGVSFVTAAGTQPGLHLAFTQALDDDDTVTFNIERELFDAELLAAAGEVGVDVRLGTAVRGIEKCEAGDVVLRTDAATIRARALVDASGHGTLVGRKLGTRRTLAGHERVAYFSHLTGVHVPYGEPLGYGVIVMFDEGWFWLIPIDEERTSVGVVIPAGLANDLGIPARDVLAWAVRRCPEMRKRCDTASIPEHNEVIANFSYTCRPFAGPGWVLVGDAAGFVDPIFSGGVTLAIMSGRWAADAVTKGLRDPSQWTQCARLYDRRLGRAMRTLFNMIENYYKPAYRDLLCHGTGPLQVHRATIELLTGRGFPSPRVAVAWRMQLMKVFGTLQRFRPLVPRAPRWSILETSNVDVPAGATR